MLRAESGKHAMRRPGIERAVALGADAPAPPSLALQQEYVIGVEVGADPAAVCGIAHEYVVQPRVGYETEPAQQRVGFRNVKVESVHEQRPLSAGKRGERGPRMRAAAHGPVRTAAQEQLGLDILAGRQAKKIGRLHDAGEGRNGLPHEQRLFLPVLRQEARRREAAQ